MVAYVVVIREKTHDKEKLAAYTAKARVASAAHSMTIRSYGKRHEVLEGAALEAIAILEFPSFEEAERWYNSPAYQDALPLRMLGGDHRAIIVEGV